LAPDEQSSGKDEPESAEDEQEFALKEQGFALEEQGFAEDEETGTDFAEPKLKSLALILEGFVVSIAEDPEAAVEGFSSQGF
jgi:hypothetical protein